MNNEQEHAERNNERYNLRPRRAAPEPAPQEVRNANRRPRRAARRPRPANPLRVRNNNNPRRSRRLAADVQPNNNLPGLPERRRLVRDLAVDADIYLNDLVQRRGRFMGDGYIEPWPFIEDDPADIIPVLDESDMELEDNDSDDSDDSDSDVNSDSSHEPQIPLFRIGDDSDNDNADSDEGEGLVDDFWQPFEPFVYNNMRDVAGDFHNFMDVFRRIAYGLNSTRTTIQLDTLPPARAPDPEKIDLYSGNLPPQGSIPIHRSFLISPFSTCIVDAIPNDVQRRHIFLTNYTRDCWNGLQDRTKQIELRAYNSKIWCSVETSNMIRKYYSLLYLEVQDLIHTLETDRLHQILSGDEKDNITVLPISIDNMPGSCMYFMSKEGMFLLHTGSNAAHDNFTEITNRIKTLCPRLDMLYVDTALYFPGPRENFQQKLDVQKKSLTRIITFIDAKVHDQNNKHFVTIRFRAGMENLLISMVKLVRNLKVGITEDLFELNYKELIKYNDKILKVNHLDSSHLSQENAHIFFYTQEYSEFDHLYATNSDHIKLEIIYDYHSSINKVTEPRGCENTIFQKNRAFQRHLEEGEEDKVFYGLFPSHPNTEQVKSMIKQLKPDKIFGLSRAPGVGYTELKDEIRTLCEPFNRR